MKVLLAQVQSLEKRTVQFCFKIFLPSYMQLNGTLFHLLIIVLQKCIPLIHQLAEVHYLQTAHLQPQPSSSDKVFSSAGRENATQLDS